MNTEGKNIVVGFVRRWQSRLLLEVLLYGVAIGAFVYFIGQNTWQSVFGFLVAAGIASLIIKPWKPNLKAASSYLDAHIKTLEYSTGLLLQPMEQLSNVAKLQERKIAKHLRTTVKKISPPGNILRSLVIATFLILIGFLAYQFNWMSHLNSVEPQTPLENTIFFQPKDSAAVKPPKPEVTNQQVTIRYPKYTNKKAYTTTNMDIKVLEGSQVFWQLSFDSEVKEVSMQSLDNDYPMTLKDGSYRKNHEMRNSGFYNFKFEDLENNPYSSNLYSIEVFPDASPKIEIQGLKQFSSFDFNEEKLLQFTTVISDDYGISKAHIIATVSKGSGESVKFREERLPFDDPVNAGSKNLRLSRKIDLNAMKMEPGDELYFYVETADYKEPAVNVSRSETYFAAIKDTTSYTFGVEGTLGVDRMPDYFRSQRQLIIDTEKLIREKKQLSTYDFKFTSNELGFDQKALRLKYGAFMGEETEIALAESEDPEGGEGVPVDTNEDPLAEYTHDHDGDNEHNLVADNPAQKEEASKNPLQEFMHDHGDPEMATLFEESLKVKLLKALSEMWDAELYLRLYQPEKSLPYQYRALKLIQDIKNDARIYVHRIGFDPPPIKEDKRLTGKLDEVSSFRKAEDISEEAAFPSIKQSIGRLEELINEETDFTENDIILFEQAGNELSVLAIQFPGKYLNTLQQLKWITDGTDRSLSTLREVRYGLFAAIPKTEMNPNKESMFMNEINQLLLKELDLND